VLEVRRRESGERSWWSVWRCLPCAQAHVGSAERLRQDILCKTTSPEYHAIDESSIDRYGVATISRRLESIRLFGEYRSLL